MKIPNNEYCPICGGITKYNCLTFPRDHLDCKCKKVDNSPGAMLDRASDALSCSLDNLGSFKGPRDIKYILECIIASCMIINNRTKDVEIPKETRKDDD